MIISVVLFACLIRASKLPTKPSINIPPPNNTSGAIDFEKLDAVCV